MQKIIEFPSAIRKKKLEIGIWKYDYNQKQGIGEFMNPKELDSIILTRPSTISTEILKLNPSLNVLIFQNGKPTHTILPLNTIPKILKNEELFRKLSKYKRKKLAYVFCKSVCSQRIKVLMRMNESRNSDKVKNLITSMRKLDRKLINASDRNELMAIEGNIAKLFYQALSIYHPAFAKARNKEGKDLVNVLMNLAHTILRNKVYYQLLRNGLNPENGFLHHRADRKQPYLCWDFSEMWMAYCDKLVFHMINYGIVKFEDLKKGRLNTKAIRKTIELINKRIPDTQIDMKLKQFTKYLKGEGRFNFKI